MGTWVDATVIEGEVVYRREDDRRLAELLRPDREDDERPTRRRAMTRMTSDRVIDRRSTAGTPTQSTTTMPRTLAPIALAALLAATTAAATAAAPREAVAYRAATIHTGIGPPVHDAVLLVVDGRIAAVGPRGEVEVPETAAVVDLGPASVLIPGLVVAETGLGEVSSDDERALTPEVRAIDGFDPFADCDRVLAGGVTTVQLSPGRTRLMPGLGAVVKLDGKGAEARS